MTRRTIAFALLSSLVLSAGACKSSLGPNLSGLSATNSDNPAGDDSGGLIGGQGADDPAGDDNGGLVGGHGADDPAGDDHGGARPDDGGQGRGGLDDPANHQ